MSFLVAVNNSQASLICLSLVIRTACSALKYILLMKLCSYTLFHVKQSICKPLSLPNKGQFMLLLTCIYPSTAQFLATGPRLPSSRHQMINIDERDLGILNLSKAKVSLTVKPNILIFVCLIFKYLKLSFD